MLAISSWLQGMLEWLRRCDRAAVGVQLTALRGTRHKCVHAAVLARCVRGVRGITGGIPAGPLAAAPRMHT